MDMIVNPIIPGMAPDPSIIRAGADYYIATSTFHWAPGVVIYHSRDLMNWQQCATVLQNDEIDLRGTNTPAGIWAPHLSYDETEKKFWLAYSLMENMAGREFNAQSYAMWANDIKGPWSEPIYLTSIGFDPSLYHEAGRHYLAILEWETRSGYQAPGHLAMAEINLSTGKLMGKWHRLTTGFTTRGCIEAPQIYKHDGYYYMLAASGGTGYGHGIEMGRSKDIFGPYESNPTGEPILTSSPRHLFSLGDPDAGHFEMFNPHSPLQKAGHGSLVETPDHEWYITHLMSRPLPGTKLNPLGRETGLQKVRWTKEGWLELEDSSNLAKLEVPAPKAAANAKQNFHANDIFTDFATEDALSAFFTPYHLKNKSWADIKDGHLELYGGNSFFSQVAPSILATRATSFKYSLQVKLSFSPNHYSERAGTGLYYDSNNWLYAYLALDDKEEKLMLCLMQAKLGERLTYDFDTVPMPDTPIELRLDYNYGTVKVFYRLDENAAWQQLSGSIDASYLSDEGVNGEPGEIGGFTGLFNFIGAVDAHQHDSHGNYYYYQVTSAE
ncbi:family 43 glycosylhydrolase [Selenomonas sp. KH1T6]|uniref:family 43 glycosylhydrolase n=1 Tax=Selenomonas sp. KH1T6 TaxID=3158784 RepID=UPI0008A7BFD6|nr:xylan 1,4-beta-xylosidase [Selenomonas ruminantium]